LDEFFYHPKNSSNTCTRLVRTVLEKDFIPVVPDWSEFFIFYFFKNKNPIPVAAGMLRLLEPFFFLVSLLNQPTTKCLTFLPYLHGNPKPTYRVNRQGIIVNWK
jgi:hypothetical protein